MNFSDDKTFDELLAELGEEPEDAPTDYNFNQQEPSSYDDDDDPELGDFSFRELDQPQRDRWDHQGE